MKSGDDKKEEVKPAPEKPPILDPMNTIYKGTDLSQKPERITESEKQDKKK